MDDGGVGDWIQRHSGWWKIGLGTLSARSVGHKLPPELASTSQ